MRADYSVRISVRSRLQWTVYVERMADDRLPKRATELREEGSRGRGRPRLRWEDSVKRDVRKAGEEEDRKKKTRDGGGWKMLSDEAVKKLRAVPHPWQREKEEGRDETETLCPRVAVGNMLRTLCERFKYEIFSISTMHSPRLRTSDCLILLHSTHIMLINVTRHSQLLQGLPSGN